ARRMTAPDTSPADGSRAHVVGLISDTHGLLRPAVFDALAGVELILHAGDVGGPDLLAELGAIAPVHAVFGNTDPPGVPWLTESLDLVVGGLRVHVQHGHELGRPNPERVHAAYPDADVCVYGHTHRQMVWRAPDGRVVVNPGAAGHRRFDLVPCVARLTVQGGYAEVDLIPL
ncbi:MAG TPA: metallophosphoesterase family protein, partial [Gemmatirosa sp.]